MKTPRFLGERMRLREDGSLFAICNGLDVKLEVKPPGEFRGCSWQLRTANGVYPLSVVVRASGPRAAAQAAERWLLTRAELTLLLARKRAA